MYERVNPEVWGEYHREKHGSVMKAYQGLAVGDVMEVPERTRSNITNVARRVGIRIETRKIDGRVYVRRIE